MAGDGTTYQIDIATNAAGVEPAAAQVARLANELTASSSAAAKAAEAVKAGEAAYKAAENGANRAALAYEKIGIAARSASGAKLENLLARQAEAATKAQAAKVALDAEATSLDKLKAAAGGATSAQANISKALERAKSSAEALKKAAPTGKVNELAEGFGRLGGPLGLVGQKVFGAADGIKKLGSSLGSTTGLLAAGAVGVAAIVAGILAATAAAVAGIGAITLWAVKLADKDNKLGQLGDKVKKSFARIFGGLNIKPLLGELGKMVSIFDEGTATSKALKAVFESLFQPIVDGITALIPKLVTGFIKFEILVLKALIAIKPFGAVFEAIGIGIAIVVVVIAVLVAAVVAAGILMVAAFAALIALPFYIADLFKWLGGAISDAITVATDWISTKFQEVMAWLSGLSLSDIGTSLIQGLIDGLIGAGGGVLKAITGVVGGAIDGAKSLLGIASPSKVFAEIGGHTAEGMAQGVDDGASAVQGSMQDLVTPPDAVGKGGATSSVSSSSSGAGANLSGATFNFYGVKDAEAAEDMLRSAFANLLMQSGTAVPSAP